MSSSLATDTLKQNIENSLNKLSLEGLREVATFLDYIRFKFKIPVASPTPYPRSL